MAHVKRRKTQTTKQNTRSKKATKELSSSLSKLSFLMLESLLSLSLQKIFCVQ